MYSQRKTVVDLVETTVFTQSNLVFSFQSNAKYLYYHHIHVLNLDLNI